MFLSKVSLQHSEQAKNSLLNLTKNGVYAAHQLLWQLFTYDDKRQFLFREDRAVDGRPEFLVLSKHRPLELQHLFIVQTKNFNPKFTKGSRLAYKLRVNPTISIKSEDGTCKRHDVLMHAKYKARSEEILDSKSIQLRMYSAAKNWLMDDKRLDRFGIAIDVLPDIETYTQHKIRKSKNEAIKFSSVDMQGILTVQDSNQFINTLLNGIGRSKSMGCGLMLVRRI